MKKQGDDEACGFCGLPEKQHWAVNYSDGQMVSGSVLICRTAVYESRKDRQKRLKPKKGSK